MGNEVSQQVKYGEKLENNVEIKWEKMGDVTNNFPGRDGHCSCAINGKLYVLGGITPKSADSMESNDLLVFDFGENCGCVIENELGDNRGYMWMYRAWNQSVSGHFVTKPFRPIPFRPIPFRPIPFRPVPFRNQIIILVFDISTLMFSTNISYTYQVSDKQSIVENTCIDITSSFNDIASYVNERNNVELRYTRFAETPQMTADF